MTTMMMLMTMTMMMKMMMTLLSKAERGAQQSQ